MMQSPTLLDLAARCETADGPSRELDVEIAFAIRWRPTTKDSQESFALHEAKYDYATSWIAHAPFRHEWPIPRYTGSLDAAMLLIQDGAYWHLANGRTRPDEPLGAAQIISAADGTVIAEAEAATPALALASACLRALAAKE